MGLFGGGRIVQFGDLYAYFCVFVWMMFDYYVVFMFEDYVQMFVYIVNVDVVSKYVGQCFWCNVYVVIFYFDLKLGVLNGAMQSDRIFIYFGADVVFD